MFFKHPFGIVVRPMDKWGSGNFGAQRDGGARAHMGLDLAVLPGTPIYAPCECTVLREARPYEDDARFSGLLLRLPPTSDDGVIELKVFYIAPIVTLIGKHVTSADCIGIAQDLRVKYDGITPHTHWEVTKGGQRVDPSPFFGLEVA